MIQYSIAVDRLNERVADLYQATHPGVLRMIRMVVDAGQRFNVRTCMCGEMAGDVELVPLLVGLGLDELSIACGQVPRVKQAIRKLNQFDCVTLAIEALKLSDAAEIRALSRVLALEAYPELLG